VQDQAFLCPAWEREKFILDKCSPKINLGLQISHGLYVGVQNLFWVFAESPIMVGDKSPTPRRFKLRRIPSRGVGDLSPIFV
jgi:hypothetical protein